MKEGFEKCANEHTLFVKSNIRCKLLIVSLYDDDLIYTRNDDAMMREFKDSMMKEFYMSDLGKMRYFLGIKVQRLENGIFINQKKYAIDVLKRFRMEDCNVVLNPNVPGFKIAKDESGIEVTHSISN